MSETPERIEQLVMKLYGAEPLTTQERCALGALLDSVAGAHSYAESCGSEDNATRAAMWLSVRAAYKQQVDRLTVQPAVSEDQPKPRVWHKGDPEPVEDGLRIRDAIGDVAVRHDGWWRWLTIGGCEVPPPVRWKWSDAQGADEFDWPATEVLADSEQVRHG